MNNYFTNQPLGRRYHVFIEPIHILALASAAASCSKAAAIELSGKTPVRFGVWYNTTEAPTLLSESGECTINLSRITLFKFEKYRRSK